MSNFFVYIVTLFKGLDQCVLICLNFYFGLTVCTPSNGTYQLYLFSLKLKMSEAHYVFLYSYSLLVWCVTTNCILFLYQKLLWICIIVFTVWNKKTYLPTYVFYPSSYNHLIETLFFLKCVFGYGFIMQFTINLIHWTKRWPSPLSDISMLITQTAFFEQTDNSFVSDITVEYVSVYPPIASTGVLFYCTAGQRADGCT